MVTELHRYWCLIKTNRKKASGLLLIIAQIPLLICGFVAVFDSHNIPDIESGSIGLAICCFLLGNIIIDIILYKADFEITSFIISVRAIVIFVTTIIMVIIDNHVWVDATKNVINQSMMLMFMDFLKGVKHNIGSFEYIMLIAFLMIQCFGAALGSHSLSSFLRQFLMPLNAICFSGMLIGTLYLIVMAPFILLLPFLIIEAIFMDGPSILREVFAAIIMVIVSFFIFCFTTLSDLDMLDKSRMFKTFLKRKVQ